MRARTGVPVAMLLFLSACVTRPHSPIVSIVDIPSGSVNATYHIPRTLERFGDKLEQIDKSVQRIGGDNGPPQPFIDLRLQLTKVAASVEALSTAVHALEDRQATTQPSSTVCCCCSVESTKYLDLSPVWQELLRMQDRVTHLQAQKQEDDYAFFRLLISLIQLLIWPSVVIVLALLFHNPISQWIRTLEVKLSTILGELKAKPQTLKELNARVEEEADTYQVTEQDVRTAHLLALERIEREFGGNMRPNVLIHGTPFDAVTWGSWRGRVIAIEVEFVGNEHAKVSSQIPQLVSGANAVAQKYNRNVFSLVLAFVTIDINEKALREKQAEWQQEANDSSDIRVFVRVYDYQTLRAEGSGSSSK